MQHLPLPERFRRLPRRFTGLVNSDLRSIAGDALHLADIDPGGMQLYAEFDIGDALMRRGLLDDLKRAAMVAPGARGLPDGIALDPRAARIALRKLLIDPHLAAFVAARGLTRRHAIAASAALAAAGSRLLREAEARVPGGSRAKRDLSGELAVEPSN
jgi:hypothetical protein